MSKFIRKRCSLYFPFRYLGMKSASIALCSLAAAPALKAQGLWIHGTYSPHTANIPSTNNPAPPAARAATPAPAPVANPAPAPAQTPAVQPAPAGTLQTTLPPPALQAVKPRNNEIAASGDFMYGDGQVTLPLGYSAHATIPSTTISENAFSLPRASTYYGGTVSYSYGQAWYVDFSYAHGSTSGNQVIDTGFLGPLPSSFSIDDTWYQAYLKYTFPQLRGKNLSAYIRAGASYITADISDVSTGNQAGKYSQKDSTDDILGNVGLGVGYSLYSTRRFRLGVQVEAEGFYGVRSQSSVETFANYTVGGSVIVPQTASIDNNLYGGIGRATLRAEYRLGRTGLFKVFGEAGLEARYTEIDYPNAGTFNEYLWGPYAKLGLRYAF